MRKRSSKAEQLAYKLFTEEKAYGWRARPIAPDGVPVPDESLEGPFLTRVEAESQAEAVARSHASANQNAIP
jgi:hypothetical protein